MDRDAPYRQLLRVEWEIFKLTFDAITDAGFADGSVADDIDTPLGFSRTEFTTEAQRIAWWAEVGSRFRTYSNRFVVRWLDPAG